MSGIAIKRRKVERAPSSVSPELPSSGEVVSQDLGDVVTQDDALFNVPAVVGEEAPTLLTVFGTEAPAAPVYGGPEAALPEPMPVPESWSEAKDPLHLFAPGANDSVWDDVSGATAPAYVPPSLHLGLS